VRGHHQPIPDATHGIRGYAPKANCTFAGSSRRAMQRPCGRARLLPPGRYDLACIGFGCERGSAIVERVSLWLNNKASDIIGRGRNTAGTVLFPACSPHVVAVGAMGQAGSYPDDSRKHSGGGGTRRGGLFVPPFSCAGPNSILRTRCAVVACQSPDGYAICDGTSLAAAHVTALAALILAHHGDFRGSFARADFQRVERLFQILKDTAQPIAIPGRPAPDCPTPRARLASGLSRGRLRRSMPDWVTCATPCSIWTRFTLARARRTYSSRCAVPANVTRLPLNPFPLTFLADSGAETVRTCMNLKRR